MSDDGFELNGIRDADFQSWKHHPVTKVFLRYVADYRDALRRDQIEKIENAEEPMPPKAQGEYKGRIRTLEELAGIEFGHLVDFYPLEEQEEDPDEA